jgi:predicted TIM-barrel fold metal-dependent hydrolase
MFESNFPVDRRACSYTVLWNAFQKMTSSYTAEERDALFAGTAARTYRIDLHAPRARR